MLVFLDPDREQTGALVEAPDNALLDGLVEGGRFEAEPTLVRALKSRPRPAPFEADEGKSSIICQSSLHHPAGAHAVPSASLLAEFVRTHPSGPLVAELFALALTNRSPNRAVAWHGLSI